MKSFKEVIFVLMPVLILVPCFTTATIDDYLNKYYDYESGEKFDKVLDALGLWYMRPVAPLWKPRDYLKKSGDVYTYHSVSFLYHLEQDFRLEETKTTQTLDGRTVKSTFTTDGDTLREHQEENNGRVTTIDREFTRYTLTIKIKVGNITAVRYHNIAMNFNKKDEQEKEEEEETPEKINL